MADRDKEMRDLRKKNSELSQKCAELHNANVLLTSALSGTVDALGTVEKQIGEYWHNLRQDPKYDSKYNPFTLQVQSVFRLVKATRRNAAQELAIVGGPEFAHLAPPEEEG